MNASRRKALNDFKKDGNGKYVYRGSEYFYAPGNRLSLPAAVTRLWLWAALLFAASAAQGCIPTDGMTNCAYVLTPCCAQIICSVTVLWALVQMIGAKSGLREYEYAASVQVLPRRALLTAVFAAATLVGECVYLALHGVKHSLLTVLVTVLLLLSGAAGLLLRRLARSLLWECREPGGN